MKFITYLALLLGATLAQGQTAISAVYFGQTHVLKANDAYFGLVGNREALIKVHVTAPGAPTSPTVTATLTLSGQPNHILTLTGPATLPASIPDGPGVVLHSFANTFTGYLPPAYVKKGLQISVNAGSATTNLTNIDIGAPNKVIMTMFDVHYFSKTTGNYPTNTFAEIEAKWPVVDLELRRIPDVVFPELVIPPRGGARAARIKSQTEYELQTGLTFDGEQAAALEWNAALKRASGRSGRWSLYYLNVYNAAAGGQAGGFAGVGNGTSVGILHHEVGHAFSLPHWGDSAAYPYKGNMHGIAAPNNYNGTHSGPAWAFDLRTKAFIPPTVQAGNVGGNPVGTYKVDPMQGGGTGFQEPAYLMNHFSDYSVEQMRGYLQSHIVVWNQQLGSNGSYATWNQTAGGYTTTVSNNGIQFPVTRDTQVVSVMATMSGANPDVNMIYPPIGPYNSGLIRVFDATLPADRTAANTLFALSNNCDYCARVVQNGVTKTYILPASSVASADPFNANSLETEAINLPASAGEITKIELLSTPNVEDMGLPANPTVLYTWAPLTPATASFEAPPVAYGTSAVTMRATEGELAFGYSGTIEYLFTETSGNPGGTSSTWQTSRTYTDIGLSPGTPYSYTVSMRAGAQSSSASAPASATTFSTPALQNVTVNSTQQFSLQSGSGLKSVTGLGSFNAGAADKLVVVISTEDSNNRGIGYVYEVRYNGRVMTEALQEDAGSSNGTAAIFFLDNPGSIGSGAIQVSAENPNGGMGCAYALSNTSPGFGASNSRAGSSINSVTMTTAGERSVVIAVINNSGNSNTSGTPTATTASPSSLTQASSGSWGSQWGGHASGFRLVPSPASITPAFSTLTGSAYSISVAAVEFPARPPMPNRWIQTAGNTQNWTTSTNWDDGVVPNPTSGTTMDFSTVNIVGNTTLNLGADRSAGLWMFGDTSGTQLWTVNAGQILTLAGTTPGFQINNGTTQIDSIVAGTAGLTKTGAGNLTLTGANTYTGATTINAGTLRMGGSSATTGVAVNNAAVLQIGSATGLTSASDVTLAPGTTLDLSANSATIGTLTTDATSIITNNSTATNASTATTSGTPTRTDALTISPFLTASVPARITDGATRKTQIVVTNSNANIQNTINTANTYSGGLVLANPVSGTGTRLSVGTLTGTPFGTSPIIIGQAATDRAGVFFGAAAAFPNEIVFNTAVGTDRVGIRCDAAVTLSGKINANLAPATFTSNSATGGSVTITGQITGASGLVLDITSKSAAATSFNVTLNNIGTPNNYSGNTVINLNAAFGKSATLHLGAANQIPNGSSTGNVTIDSNGTGVGTLNLAGFSETINSLGGDGIVDGTSGTPTLTLGDNNATGTFSGIIRSTAGTLSLVKIGTGIQTLSGTNTYAGTTTISGGTLALGANNVLPATAVSIGTATLNAATFSDTLGSLDVTGSAVINLGGGTFSFADSSTIDWTGGTLTITGTFVSGSSLRFGTTATALSAAQLARISGGGFTSFSLTSSGHLIGNSDVTFASWQTTNGSSGAFTADHDSDGVSNGIEYFSGGSSNTTGQTPMPDVANISGTLSVTWTKSATYPGTYGTHFWIETSDSLTGSWTQEALGVNTTINSNTITYTFPAGTRRFVRLKVQGPY